MHARRIICLFGAALIHLSLNASVIQIQVTDRDGDGEPLPCRIHITNEAGQAVLPDDLPIWNDHFVCSGAAEVTVADGEYVVEVERGHEFLPYRAEVKVGGSRDGESVKRIEVVLSRNSNVRSLGWFGGDLHVHRPVEDVPLLMRAEDLDVAPVITWWNDRNLWKDRPQPKETKRVAVPLCMLDVMAGEDEREGGALLFFGLSNPLPITGASREYPSPMDFVNAAHEIEPAVHIDIEKPFWWDTPVWVASGKADSIGLANNHMCRSQMYENEAWGRPRDEARLPPPTGNGYWSQEIYYHILNSGIRLPPSAGSASGVLPNPVGYNRVYVHLDGPLKWDDWWDGLREGRSFVTNGPMLICRANGQLPGAVFRIRDEPLSLELDISVKSKDPINQIEIVRNGHVAQTIAADELNGLRLKFAEPGWFLIRAIAENRRTFRFASTAPFFVESDQGSRRVSRTSVQFFLDWLKERHERVTNSLTDEQERESVLVHHRAARRFWLHRLNAATAD